MKSFFFEFYSYNFFRDLRNTFVFFAERNQRIALVINKVLEIKTSVHLQTVILNYFVQDAFGEQSCRDLRA